MPSQLLPRTSVWRGGEGGRRGSLSRKHLDIWGSREAPFLPRLGLAASSWLVASVPLTWASPGGLVGLPQAWWLVPGVPRARRKRRRCCGLLRLCCRKHPLGSWGGAVDAPPLVRVSAPHERAAGTWAAWGRTGRSRSGAPTHPDEASHTRGAAASAGEVRRARVCDSTSPRTALGGAAVDEAS